MDNNQHLLPQRHLLSRVIFFVKTHKAIVLLSAAFLLILIALLLRALTPSTPPKLASIPVPNTPTLKKSNFSTATVILPSPESTFPPSLPIYTTTPMSSSLQLLASRLDLSLQESQGVWTKADKSAYLSQDLYSGRIGYLNTYYSGDFDEALAVIVEKNKALEIARGFLQERLELNNFVPLVDQATYTQKGFQTYVVSADKANVISIPFAYQLQGKPVYSDIDTIYPVVVSVDSAGAVVGFSLSPSLFTSAFQQAEVKTLPISTISNQIISGNVSVLRIISDFEDGFIMDNITRIDVHSIQLDYRLVTQENKILPYFHLFATITNQQNHTSEVELMTPAVITK